jgi:OmpA-OmpF porin, OOP family
MSSRLYVLAVIAGLSVAPARAADNPAGYLISGQDGAPVTAGYGECVHTGRWTPDTSYRQCDPRPVAAAPVQLAPEPAPARVAAEPAPVAAETPALEAPRAVPFRISMDTLFDFDSSVLRADAGPALDEFATRLSRTEYQTVDIVGHADRIGGAKHNQQLSERRAGAVRDYLVAKGLDGSRIAVSGVGTSEPITGSQCQGLRGNSLISCLQPDRYTEVTVTGTQTSAVR